MGVGVYTVSSIQRLTCPVRKMQGFLLPFAYLFLAGAVTAVDGQSTNGTRYAVKTPPLTTPWVGT